MSGPRNALADVVIGVRSREDPVTQIPVALGSCECPGRPHETITLSIDGADVETQDHATVKSHLHYLEFRQVIAATRSGELGLAERTLLVCGIIEWNLTTIDENGAHRPLPITGKSDDKLSPSQAMPLLGILDQPEYLIGADAPPNPRGAPSRNGRARSRR